MKTTNERTITEYVVLFDNGTSHHCKEFDKARQFAREMCGVGTYGNATEIVKFTRHITRTWETVWKES